MTAWLWLAFALHAPVAFGDSPRELLYLHGRIVQEQQSPRPTHPEWGTYELEAILAAFRARGFEVTGGIRPKSSTVSESAERVVEQVRARLAASVPPRRITVVGASMGASIAFLASLRLQQPELGFVVLGACLSANVRALEAEHGRRPVGRFLSIREKSDTLSEPCEPWQAPADPKASLSARELVIDTGLHHGFLYRPLPEWLEPAIAFANAR